MFLRTGSGLPRSCAFRRTWRRSPSGGILSRAEEDDGFAGRSFRVVFRG
jgi:hypothetical protein